jgi:carboxypeptidase family protein
MSRVVLCAAVVCALASLLVPAEADAQERASIIGVVQDSSGAVLPGVTVEAASPALIERVRSGVTDGSGRFAIIDLRPGTYAVTFTLAGFRTVKREGIILEGAFAAQVNASLHQGKQYIVMAAGAGAQAELIGYALPGPASNNAQP